MKTKFLSIWKPLASVIFWGISFIATKEALNELRPLTIVFMRLVFGAGFLMVVAVKRKRSFAIKPRDIIGIIILAVIASLHLGVQVAGLQFTTASNTGWIIGISPVFMALLGWIFFKEKLKIMQTLGILIAFSGLLLLVSRGDFTNIGLIANKGDLMVLVSAFTWAVYSFVGKKVTLNYPPVMTILYLFFAMMLILSPFTINSESIDAVIKLSITGWFSVLFLGIFCSGLAYVFWAEAMKEMHSSKVGAFLYLEPFVTVFAAWILLNENITFLMMLSGIIILAGVVLVNRK
jgi:drug/metabolite transporter (DMT)-like permease